MGGRGSVNGTSTAYDKASGIASIDDSFEEHALQEVGQPRLKPFDGPAGVVHEPQIVIAAFYAAQQANPTGVGIQ